MTFAEGSKYEGEFYQNLAQGKGTFSYSNGDFFLGEF